VILRDNPQGLPERFASHLTRLGLLDGLHRIGLAVSGGADSVALFRLMVPFCRKAGIEVVIVHFNHGLVGSTETEASFVHALADKEGLTFIQGNAKLGDRPRPAGLSMEMAARQARMDFFQELAPKRVDAIVTAHQADDVVETFLLRLKRGAGPAGLSALRPKASINGFLIRRPLLPFTKEELRTWLKSIGQPWLEDVSNTDTAIPRNFIRHVLLPELEKEWDAALRSHILQTASILSEEDAWMEDVATWELYSLRGAEDSLPLASLRRMPLALLRRVLRKWLFGLGQDEAAGFETIEAVAAFLHGTGNGALPLPGGCTLKRSDDTLALLRVTDASPIPGPVAVSMPGVTEWGLWRLSIEAARGWQAAPQAIGQSPSVCYLSCAACDDRGFILRGREPGDRIAPTGLDGSRKIQDVLVDAKIPTDIRDGLPLLVSGNEVVCLPGFRINRAFAVPSQESPSYRLTFTRT
jgi:tRNA(Ile)-lysidine synthase